MPMRAVTPTSRRIPSRKTPDTVLIGGLTPMTKKNTAPALVITCIQRAGGGGKTTTSTALATHLALRGYATLYIEFDGHARAFIRLIGNIKRNAPALDVAQTSFALLQPETYHIEKASFRIDMDATFNRSSLSVDTIARVKQERGWNNPNILDIIPGHPKLESVDSDFAIEEYKARSESTTFDPNMQSEASIEHLRQFYDYIICDTPASLRKLAWNALIPADLVFMPIGFDPGSIEDYDETIRTFQQVVSVCERKRKPIPRFIGVVGNYFNADSALSKSVFQSYIGPHPDPDTNTMVPAAIPYPLIGCLPMDQDTVANAWAKHMTVHTSAPQSTFGKALHEFCKTVESIGGR